MQRADLLKPVRRPTRRSREMSKMTVVVGVDGSPDGHAALEFAVEEAVLRPSRLRVIAAVHLPDCALSALTNPGVPPPPDRLVEEVRKAPHHEGDQVLAARAD